MTLFLIADTDPPALPDARMGAVLGLLNTINEKVTTMSATLTQFATDLAANTAAVAALKTAAAEQLAAIQALQATVASGGEVTAADLATLEANTAEIVSVTSAMTPAAPVTAAAPGADPGAPA